jgi:hypothetical protein
MKNLHFLENHPFAKLYLKKIYGNFKDDNHLWGEGEEEWVYYF